MADGVIQRRGNTFLPKLLVVDDDEQILKQIQWALSDEYEVFSAADSATALHIFKSEGIRVVLLDLGLPPSHARPLKVSWSSRNSSHRIRWSK